MGTPLRVLFVEDSENDAALVVRELQRGGYDPISTRVDTPAAMKEALLGQRWDAVIADYSMPHFSAHEALGLLKDTELDLPFIIVSGSIGEETAIAAMKAGAHDYLIKNNLTRLVPAIERELKDASVRRERRRAEETIQHLAYYDALTDLPNRALLYDRLQQAILAGHREEKPFALLLLDLDRFKEINDTMGHGRGDLLLQQVATRLRDALRKSDTMARLGGDEFAAVLPNTKMDGATLIARKILEAFNCPFIMDDLSLEIGVSIGIAVFPEHGADADTLMRRADVAMYVSKQTESGYAVYTSEQDRYAPHRLALMGELRHAINNGHFFLLYQPTIDLHTAGVSAVEALVRWRHPDLGVIQPDEFIALGEQAGLMKPLTLWVLNAALRQCHVWRQAGMDIAMAVNISARNLQDPQLPDQVAEILHISGVSPDELNLEITESVIMADAARAMQILTRLRKMGVHLSIDDFGTGYSSLSYLKKLPVDAIKIDKSFVMDMAVDRDDAAIVQSIIDLGHNLGLKIVAEGVENQETWDQLTALGCDAAQGYYMSRPIPATELPNWFHHSLWGAKKVMKQVGDRAM